MSPKSTAVKGKRPKSELVTCTWCGASAEAVPLDWTVQTSDRGRGTEYLCPACARSNLRSIEARLDADWW